MREWWWSGEGVAVEWCMREWQGSGEGVAVE